MVGIPGKFGDLSLVRLLHNTNNDVTTGTNSVRDRGLVSGASQKADYIASTHIRETVITLSKAALIPGGSDSLVYSSLHYSSHVCPLLQ